MLMCSGCLDRCHLQCLDKPLEKLPAQWSSWMCLGCKTCEGCGKDGSKIRLAICDVCDRGYHIGCLAPPLKSFPLRAFKCPDCVECTSCGEASAGGERTGRRRSAVLAPLLESHRTLCSYPARVAGTKTAKLWTRDYQMCDPCGKQFKERRFCPICMKAHRADEDQMIHCDGCNYWVHARPDVIPHSFIP